MHRTSLFLELVSVPTEPCFSMSTVDAPPLSCSFRAIASPTTPPPMTACVKSASRRTLDERCRLVAAFKIMLEKARVGIMMPRKERTKKERSTPTKRQHDDREIPDEQLRLQASCL